nr:hypothetical protein [Tanacetum cinerariifolium]
MSTHSSARNLFPPLDNPELTIRKRSRADPTLLNDFEMAAEGNGDLPVPDLRTMEELCQPSLNGRGGPIAPIAIQATNFGLKNDMIQQVQNSGQFRGLPGDDANKHLDKFLHVTQSIKVNRVTDDALHTFYNGLTLRHHDTINAAAGGTFMKRHPKECYDLIKNMIAHHNDWDTSAQRSESSISITFSFDTKIAALKAEMAKINKNLMRVLQVNQQVKAITPNCETCGGPHSFNDCPATVSNTQNVYATGAYQVIAPPTTQTDTTLIPTETPVIAPTIPPSPDYTPTSLDYSPASETESDPSADPSSGHIPPLPAVLPFLSSDDDTTDSDTPNTPPSPIYDIPFTEITASTQRSHVIPRPSRKRRRSPMTSVPALPLVSGALSPVCADFIPSPKRVRDISYLADVEVGPRETRVERVTHPAMPKDIPEPAQEGAVEVTYETLGDLVQRFHDHTQAIPVHHIHAIEGIQREQGHRIVGV